MFLLLTRNMFCFVVAEFQERQLIIVSAWVPIHLSKPQPSNLVCPPGIENLNKSLQIDR